MTSYRFQSHEFLKVQITWGHTISQQNSSNHTMTAITSLTNTDMVKLIHFKKLQGIRELLCKREGKKKNGRKSRELKHFLFYSGWKSSRMAVETSPGFSLKSPSPRTVSTKINDYNNNMNFNAKQKKHIMQNPQVS